MPLLVLPIASESLPKFLMDACAVVVVSGVRRARAGRLLGGSSEGRVGLRGLCVAVFLAEGLGLYWSRDEDGRS